MFLEVLKRLLFTASGHEDGAQLILRYGCMSQRLSYSRLCCWRSPRFGGRWAGGRDGITYPMNAEKPPGKPALSSRSPKIGAVRFALSQTLWERSAN